MYSGWCEKLNESSKQAVFCQTMGCKNDEVVFMPARSLLWAAFVAFFAFFAHFRAWRRTIQKCATFANSSKGLWTWFWGCGVSSEGE